MNSISGWFAIPLSLAVLGVVLIVMRCLKRRHVNVELKGLGVELRINTLEKDSNARHTQFADHNVEAADGHKGGPYLCTYTNDHHNDVCTAI